MIYLLLALFFSTCIFVTFKYFEKFGVKILPAVATNYLVASCLGYFSISKTTSLHAIIQQPWILMAFFAGITFILTFVVFAVSTQRVGVAMTIVSGKMSVVLSVAAGVLILAEPLGIWKIVGLSAALAAFILTNQGRGEANIEKKYLYLPVLIFLSTGGNDILMKLSGVYYAGRDDIQFLTITFFVAFVIACLILGFRVSTGEVKPSWNDLVAGVLLGVFNWYSTYFFIKGLFVLPISLFVPVFNASLVFIAAVAGYFFFHEKLSRINRIGILIAILAIVIIVFS